MLLEKAFNPLNYNKTANSIATKGKNSPLTNIFSHTQPFLGCFLRVIGYAEPRVRVIRIRPVRLN